jgi:hypothetical protein
LIAACLVTLGCSGESPVKYDPLQDRSSVYATLSESSIGALEPGVPRVALLLSGEGKHPKEWSAAFSVECRNREGEPDFWGEKPTLVFNQDAAGGHEFSESRSTENAKQGKPSWINDDVMFHMKIDDLLFLLEYGSTYTLNGKPFKLNKEEEDKIRQAIVAAREDTNAGR